MVLVSLADHLVDLGVCQVLAEGFHDGFELVGADGAAAVLVEDGECGAGLFCKVFGLDGRGHHGDEFCQRTGPVSATWYLAVVVAVAVVVAAGQ